MDIPRLIGAASAAHAAGRFAEASSICNQVLTEEPHNVQALIIAGVVEAKVGDPLKAVQTLDLVQGMEPDSFHAVFWQSHAYKKMGRIADALQAARRAHELNPSDPQAMTQLGICQMDARLLPEAEANFRAASAMAPNIIPLQLNLSQCLHLQGKRKEAAGILRQTLMGSPQNANSLMQLAQHLLTQNNAHSAAEVARRVLEINPTHAMAKLLLARVLLEDNRGSEAEPLLAEIVRNGTDDAQAMAMYGTAAQGLGHLQDAIGAFHASLEMQPEQGYGYFGLVNSKKVVSDDLELVHRMEALADNNELPPKQQSFLQYGIGKAYEDLGDFEKSMSAYDAANRIEFDLKFRNHPFDKRKYSEPFDRTIRQFSTSFMDKNRGKGLESELPIFVVGMMRSGTTLIEQILSCHPDVGAAGEQAFWLDNWRAGLNEQRGEIDAEGIKEVGERYLRLLSEIAPGKSRVVDKMPVNYAGLGIIHSAFPNAKIIHTKRNPVDTCISIYATPNRALTEYAHDKANIVFAYRQYLKVMKHWKAVLPADRFLEVDYEDLISNSDSVTRQVVDFCGLAWDDACLKPHENKRSVVTPSVWQVRQPLYRSSIERWKRFEPWLGAFKELVSETHSS